MIKEKQHGGLTNVDRVSLQYAIDTYGAKTMIDIGCGPGGQVMAARELGLDAYGVDGSAAIPKDPKFQQVDYRKSISTFDIDFDLGWSCEFVEHVEASCLPTFMKEFQKCKRVFMTGAPPGWGGKNHVNEQPESYWIDVFQKYGFDYDEETSKIIREISITTMNEQVRPPRQQFMKLRGLVFVRK